MVLEVSKHLTVGKRDAQMGCSLSLRLGAVIMGSLTKSILLSYTYTAHPMAHENIVTNTF